MKRKDVIIFPRERVSRAAHSPKDGIPEIVIMPIIRIEQVRLPDFNKIQDKLGVLLTGRTAVVLSDRQVIIDFVSTDAARMFERLLSSWPIRKTRSRK